MTAPQFQNLVLEVIHHNFCHSAGQGNPGIWAGICPDSRGSVADFIDMLNGKRLSRLHVGGGASVVGTFGNLHTAPPPTPCISMGLLRQESKGRKESALKHCFKMDFSAHSRENNPKKSLCTWEF